jgi:hypothetical protein
MVIRWRGPRQRGVLVWQSRTTTHPNSVSAAVDCALMARSDHTRHNNRGPGNNPIPPHRQQLPCSEARHNPFWLDYGHWVSAAAAAAAARHGMAA